MSDKKRTCRICGCTDERGCPGGCFWVDEDLCSECSDITDVIDDANLDGEDPPMDQNLGTCCGCGGFENVRNVIMLNKKQPAAGKGWGCFTCGLPCDGAVAVLCDLCLELAEQSDTAIKFACVGYPKDNERIAVDLLAEPHEHDLSKHQEI